MDKMYLDTVKLTASEDDTQRIYRLSRVIGYVQALAEQENNESILDKVSKLHDHEGTMTVVWKKQPTEKEKELFKKAWESRIGDGAPNVKHEVQ